jgi:hypothetical protein
LGAEQARAIAEGGSPAQAFGVRRAKETGMTRYVDWGIQAKLEAHDQAVERGDATPDPEYRARLCVHVARELANKGTKRSKLSALEKSRIIHLIGGDNYLSLPW